MNQKHTTLTQRLVLLLIGVINVFSYSYAEIVTPKEAMNIAQKHVLSTQRRLLRKGAISQEQVTLTQPYILSYEGIAALYVFNRQEGGYIIVSAESETKSQVLAWSDKGSYDPAHVPAPMQDILDNYISGIQHLRKASTAERQIISNSLERAAQVTSHLRHSEDYFEVGPLLADIEWGQGEPYNLLVPTYDYGGYKSHYPTGCVATAIAQVMRYHQWPERGRGSHSYDWAGRTLSSNFDHAYRWNLMLPRYEYYDYANRKGNFTEEQAQEVAQLMYDVGVAVDMIYDIGGSGSNFYGARIVEFFDYDKNMRHLDGDYCSKEDWENVLRSEVDAGRPVLCAGGSNNGAHEFVCDGYNSEGLFHYNFGWDGVSNGWYVSTATGFDASPSLDYGVEKNHGGKGALSLMSRSDFLWTYDNTLEGFLSLSCSGLDYYNSDIWIEVALAVEDVETGQVSYYSKGSFHSSDVALPSLSFDEDIPDGTYRVYPVGRIANEEWQTFYHNAIHQIVVDLTVSGGVKTWANNNMLDPIDEGVVLVNGIYYLIDDSNGEATVTRRNERGNSYSGDVVIPDWIEYDDNAYIVTAIGERAFENCTELSSVVVGNNVTIVGFGAFGSASLTSISFARDSQLKTIDGWAFNGCDKLKKCELPEGLLTIGMSAFQSCSDLQLLTIPSTVNSIATYAFVSCLNLQVIRVAWTSFDNFYIDVDAFGGVNVSNVRLVVPKGYIELYRQHSVFADFNITDVDTEVIEWSWNYDNSTATLSVNGTGRMSYTGSNEWASFLDDMRHVVLNEGITSIPNLCFWGGNSIQSVELPSTLQKISYGAFYDCAKVSEIKCLANPAPDISEGDVFAYFRESGTLYVPNGADYSTWLAVLPAGWSVADDIITPVVSSTQEAIYDLFGRTVTKPQPGTIYIHQGKKFIGK